MWSDKILPRLSGDGGVAAFVGDARFRGIVLPIPTGTVRPRWSVMIPVFNGADDLRRSLQSVLAQAPGPEHMQIEVVDDCSTTDDPEASVRAIGSGRVDFFRQPANVGHSRNFTTCIQRARGEIVHILHADDWVGQGFYEKLDALFFAEPSIGAAFCRHEMIRPDGSTRITTWLEQPAPGILPNWLEVIASGLRLQPPSITVRRSVYEALGGFDARMLSCGEDWEMWVRIAAHYPVGFVPDVLAYYQDSPGSLTKRSVRSGQNVKDVRRACRIMKRYLPREVARSTNRKALEFWANWAIEWAEHALANGDLPLASVQLREALLCSRSPRTLAQIARLGKRVVRLAAQRRRLRWVG